MLDPAGPIGNWLSPTAVYKERQGLPISSPHQVRFDAATTAPEFTVAPARFIAAAEADPPKSRVRQLSAFVEERWEPVYATPAPDADLWEVMRASETLAGWKVTQHRRSAHCDCPTARFEQQAGGTFVHGACGRARRKLSADEFREVIQSRQYTAADDMYNVYMETLPGNDPVILDGDLLRARDGTVIRGGTQIRHGKREYREKTKGMVHWDKGVVVERAKALAEEDSRPVRNVRRMIEHCMGENLPMHRPVGINGRRDRPSGV